MKVRELIERLELEEPEAYVTIYIDDYGYSADIHSVLETHDGDFILSDERNPKLG
ncbi:hypothetical protein [Bacillus wiedmannii]|uniref:hypothetical protein n=1 Tax=Bacillus wiedmannii TaxID=1890302 RepID=UPI0015CF6128|nr:hypothetical protein [Bacillus wiedmannii]